MGTQYVSTPTPAPVKQVAVRHHLTMGRINDTWDQEFTPLFAEACERQVADAVKEHNAQHGTNLKLRDPKPVACWLVKAGAVNGVVYDHQTPGAIPVWVWWAEQ